MSKIFEITTVEGIKVTVNAEQVVYVSDNTDGVGIQLTTGTVLRSTETTYRSVRGYINKALNSASE